MATILEHLKGISGYPVPLRTIATIALRNGIDLDSEADADALRSKGFRLCEADIYMWLSESPDVSQGGQTYSFTDQQRLELRKKALAIYAEEESQDATTKRTFGYKGNRL